MIYWFELIGTAVFAISGALAASRKNMDIFGFAVLALMPAVGGGTVRDVLIDRHPIFWIDDTNYVYVAVAAAVATFFAAHVIRSRLRMLIWMDAIGLALFAVLGSQIAIDHGTSVPVAAIMGMVTGVVGGMIRDLICSEVPLILSREIYATAAFVAAAVFLTASGAGLSDTWSIPLGILAGLGIRAAGIVNGLSLPVYRQRD
ncbi:MAG: trimeric intracellular cation channel family protein [Woeseiaceae bacterium]